jgi:hypothetical protein
MGLQAAAVAACATKPEVAYHDEMKIPQFPGQPDARLRKSEKLKIMSCAYV